MNVHHQRLIAAALSISMLLQGCSNAMLNMDGNVAPTTVSTHVEHKELSAEAKTTEASNQQNNAATVFTQHMDSRTRESANLQLLEPMIIGSSNSVKSTLFPSRDFLATGSYYRAMHLNHPFFHLRDLMATTIAYIDCELIQAILTHIGNVPTLVSIQATCSCALCNPMFITLNQQYESLKAWHQVPSRSNIFRRGEVEALHPDSAHPEHALFVTTDVTALVANYLECALQKALFDEFGFLCILTGKQCCCVEICYKPPVPVSSYYEPQQKRPNKGSRRKNGAYLNMENAEEVVKQARRRNSGGNGTEVMRVYYDKRSKGWRIDNPRNVCYQGLPKNR
jgi:hypothetical protein